MKQAYRVSLGALGCAVAIALGCGGVGDSDALFSNGSGPTGSGGQSGATSNDGVTSSASTNSAMGTSSTAGGQTLLCGNEACPLATNNACCFSHDHKPSPQSRCVMGAPGADGCDTSTDPNGLEARITCHDESQCGAKQLCCGHRITQNGGAISYYSDVICADSCAKPNIQLCEPKGKNTCPPQTTCKKSSLLPEGYFVCGG